MARSFSSGLQPSCVKIGGDPHKKTPASFPDVQLHIVDAPPNSGLPEFSSGRALRGPVGVGPE
jgi:hypothetical protein